MMIFHFFGWCMVVCFVMYLLLFTLGFNFPLNSGTLLTLQTLKRGLFTLEIGLIDCIMTNGCSLQILFASYAKMPVIVQSKCV